MLIQEAFRLSGGDWQAGRGHLHLLREFGIEGNVSAEVFALPPSHPYLRLPLQFATALEEKLLSLVSADELTKLRKEGEAELREPGRWGTTFTLLQCWGAACRSLPVATRDTRQRFAALGMVRAAAQIRAFG